MDILAKLQRNAIRGFGVEISQVYLKKSFLLPWQPEFRMKHNSLKKFRTVPSKDTSCDTLLRIDSVVLEKMF